MVNTGVVLSSVEERLVSSVKDSYSPNKKYVGTSVNGKDVVVFHWKDRLYCILMPGVHICMGKKSASFIYMYYAVFI